MAATTSGNAPFFGGCFFCPLNNKFRFFLYFFGKFFKKLSVLASTAVAFCLAAAWLLFFSAGAGAVAVNPAYKTHPAEPEARKSPEAAAEAISGSRYPGILDHLLVSPFEQEDENGPLQVHINYPSTGKREVDADIRSWVANLADVFARHLEIAALPDSPALPEESADGFLQDNDLNIPPVEKKSYELWGDYTVSRPSENAISITFEIWNYAGNPEGNLDILTLNYNLANDQRLDLVDIFEYPDQALNLMSRYSRKVLETRLGPAGRSRMLQDGTEPLAENFASLTLTRDGVTVNFQPWQVAPWEAGIQRVEIPLTELLAANPLMSLWNM